jgi:hypothetical protein
MDNLYSEQEAKQLIEGLIPDPALRRLCLNIFVDAIHEANLYGRDKWHIEPAFDGHIWLFTGSLVTCSLVEERIWFSLDRQLMESQAGEPLACDGTATNWAWEPVDLDDPTWVHLATVINGFYMPGANHLQIWPQLRRLLNESIYRAIQNSPDTGIIEERVHSPGILAYLRNELGRHVPDPPL